MEIMTTKNFKHKHHMEFTIKSIRKELSGNYEKANNFIAKRGNSPIRMR